MIQKIGLIINPVAGIGGSVGLKGSDGEEIQKKAIALGAVKKANIRAETALKELIPFQDEIELFTYPGDMGETICNKLGFKVKVLGDAAKEKTTAEDTKLAAADMREQAVDIILFAGGDGTARDIYTAVGNNTLVLGIPAGVKIHSGVYALNPRSAGKLIALMIQNDTFETQEAEVMDIDEDAFRRGIVTAKLYGYLKVPYAKHYVQNMKSGGVAGEKLTLERITHYIITTMLEDVLYIVGPGTTTRGIAEELGYDNTLLGVDLIYNKKVIKNDANEKDVLSSLERHPHAKIIVTVIGGQNYIFGRGNQQISAEVIKRVGKENIIIISTQDKLNINFNVPLIVDTGSPEVDDYLKGYYRIVVGYEDMIMYKVGNYDD